VCAFPLDRIGALVAENGLAEAHFYVDHDESHMEDPSILAEIKEPVVIRDFADGVARLKRRTASNSTWLNITDVR
jgi:hypothetical protein